jgi:hypothetical protein
VIAFNPGAMIIRQRRGPSYGSSNGNIIRTTSFSRRPSFSSNTIAPGTAYFKTPGSPCEAAAVFGRRRAPFPYPGREYVTIRLPNAFLHGGPRPFASGAGDTGRRRPRPRRRRRRPHSKEKGNHQPNQGRQAIMALVFSGSCIGIGHVAPPETALPLRLKA